jgi:hypothetical protein
MSPWPCADSRQWSGIVSYDKSFHGRTLGSQQAGGIPALKDWIVNLDPGFVQIPFPDGFRTADNSFEGFERALRECHVEPRDVAGVILETYQGGSAALAPAAYMQALRRWCTSHKALLVCDEVQAGFGRTGTLWGFEHYGVVPDLALFGKGMSSSLPISAVAGRPDVMDLHPAGSMTSTHTGNPVCCAAALASIEIVVSEKLAENARQTGGVLHERLRALEGRFPQIGRVDGKGLVAGIACGAPGTKEPDGDLGGGGGRPVRRKRRAHVQPCRFWRRHSQDLSAIGDYRSGRPGKRGRARRGVCRGHEQEDGRGLAMKSQVLIVGGGMITHDQLLPSLHHMQRQGRIGEISICAQVIMTALRHEQHVFTVKPLVLKHAEALKIGREAYSRGLVVGVEYHKRFDDRSLMARRKYRAGLFSEFKLGTACLLEKWYYRHSNFQNWMTTGNSDAFTYVGCHYVDLVHFITGLLPAAVSVYGIPDRFPNGNPGFLWTGARVIWNNGACLNVQTALGFPDAAPGTNTQGLVMYCKGETNGALISHSDQYRGLKYSYTRKSDDPGATIYAEPSPDYFQYVDLGGKGLTPSGPHHIFEFRSQKCN